MCRMHSSRSLAGGRGEKPASCRGCAFDAAPKNDLSPCRASMSVGLGASRSGMANVANVGMTPMKKTTELGVAEPNQTCFAMRAPVHRKLVGEACHHRSEE